MGEFRKSSHTRQERFEGEHRFEHWYRDNTVYFITSKTRDGVFAFESAQAKAVFWDRFDHHCKRFGFVPWVTTLLVNHYHTIGYLKVGENLGPFMRCFHGSVTKLVNDLLPQRLTPFWRERGKRNYFDGCLRNEWQTRLAYQYTLLQAVRAGLVSDWQEYPDTHIRIDVEWGILRARELKAFMENVGYPRLESGEVKHAGRGQ